MRVFSLRGYRHLPGASIAPPPFSNYAAHNERAGRGRSALGAQDLKDTAERLYFQRVETRLQLPKEQVDKVRACCTGGRASLDRPIPHSLETNGFDTDSIATW